MTIAEVEKELKIQFTLEVLEGIKNGYSNKIHFDEGHSKFSLITYYQISDF